MTESFDDYVTRAIEWARTQLGSEAYPARCLAFVEDAYERSNHIEIFGGSTAKESADAYDVRQIMLQPPPPGAFVFYDCFGTLFDEYKNRGHVGLCIGSEQVIHAWKHVRQDHYLEIQELTPAPGWQPPQYLGWAPVDRILREHQKKEWVVP